MKGKIRFAIVVLAAVCLILGLAACGEVARNSLRGEIPSVSESEERAVGGDGSESIGKEETPAETSETPEEAQPTPAEEKNETGSKEEDAPSEPPTDPNAENAETPDFSDENKTNENANEGAGEETIDPNGEAPKKEDETVVARPSSENAERCEVCGIEKKSGNGHLQNCPHYVSFEGKNDFLEELLGYFGGFPEDLKETVGAYSTTYRFSITHMTESDLVSAYIALNAADVTFYEESAGMKYANARLDFGERIYEIEIEIAESALPPYAKLKITVSAPEA